MGTIKDPESALADTKQIVEETMDRLAWPATWIIPQSGGKDSRAAAQSLLVLIERRQLKPPARIIFYLADTMMEYWTFLEQAKTSMDQMTRKAHSLGIKAEYFITHPLSWDDFWVRIIGYGVAPPTPTFRWCTDKLKIVPSRKVLARMGIDKDHTPLFLGVRYGESDRRDKILTCSLGGECGPDYMYFKTRHNKILPVLNWSQCAVWDFLTFIAPEYGYDNTALVEHYGPDGSLRYGCWSCPLIYDDRTSKYLAAKNPILYDLITWTNAHLRRGGESWQPYNRELIYKNGNVKDGRLSLDYCRRLLTELIEMGRKYNVELINRWQMLNILGAWEWRENLPSSQHGAGGQLPLWQPDQPGPAHWLELLDSLTNNLKFSRPP